MTLICLTRSFRRWLLLLVLLLAGCAPPTKWVWQHPQGLDQQQLQQAISSCDQIAQDEIARNDYFTPYLFPYYPPYADSYYFWRHRYLYDYPYYPPSYYYDSERRFFDRQRFFRICMHAKGWRKVPLDKPH